jgi:hypothetical protein
MKQTIKKWYYYLGFPKKYDAEFEALLESAVLDENVTLKDIENSTENCPYNLLYTLYLLEGAKREYNRKGIGEEIFHDTMYDIVRWSEVWYEINGRLGLDLMGWISDHLNLHLFKLGRLQFDFGKFEKEYTDYGIVAGEKCIGVHIPSGEAMTKESCDASFEMAKEFFEKFYPEYEYNYFTCFSWLLDESLDRYNKPNSNIEKFRKRFTIIDGHESYVLLKYVLRHDAEVKNIEKFTPQSSFAKNIKQAVIDGEKFYTKLGFIKK